jgi:acyl-CoA hydrolase
MKQLSIEQLAGLLAPGEHVFVPGSAAEPVELSEYLVASPQAACGVMFWTSFVPGINARNLCSAVAARCMQVYMMQSQFGAAWASGLLYYRPLPYFDILRQITRGDQPVDTAIIQVSEPDIHGLCSLGPSVEFTSEVTRQARRLLGVINPNIPRLAASPTVPLESFEAVARSSAPLPTYDAGASNPVNDKIVSYLASLIPSGATLQLGLGKIPNQLVRALRDHRELSFHSGMLSDGIDELFANSGRRGSKLNATVAVGTSTLYQKLPEMHDLELRGVEFTHSPEVLRAVPRLHAINSAIEVDLFGQVNAEMAGGWYVSGPGGLPDFASAAHRQEEGLSVIALPSTDPKGKISRITTQFAPGTPITVPRHDVDVVVTENGAAMLRGKDLEGRMRALIDVAHPHYRSTLEKSARKMLAAA